MENKILKEVFPILNCKIREARIDVSLNGVLLCRSIEKTPKIVHETFKPNTSGYIMFIKNDEWKTVISEIKIDDIINFKIETLANNNYEIEFVIKNIHYKIFIETEKI